MLRNLDHSNGDSRGLDRPLEQLSLKQPSQFLLPTISDKLYNEFVRYWKGTNSIEQVREWSQIAEEEVAHFSERLYEHPHDHLQAIGAIYQTITGKSPLCAFPTRLPQEYLLKAHEDRFFYGTLMTH